MMKNEKGSILVIALVVFVIAVSLSGSLLWTTVYHSNASRSIKGSLKAEYTAKSALNISCDAMNRNEAIRRIEGKNGDLDSFIYLEEGSTTWKRYIDDMAADTLLASDSARKVYDNRDRSLVQRGDSNFRVMISVNGPVEAKRPNAYQAHACGAYDKMGYGMMGFVNPQVLPNTLPGMTGYNGIYVKESAVVDSYNSTNGAYGPSNMNENGDLGSDGDITLNGALSTMIYGDVGPGMTGSVLGDSSQVAPGHTAAPRTTPISPPMPEKMDISWKDKISPKDKLDVKTPTRFGSATPEEYYYNTVLLQDTVTIAGDVTIYVSDKFTANATGKINIVAGGKLTLHVGGMFSYNGSFESTNQNPADFQVSLYRDERTVNVNPSAGTGYDNKINGTSAIYGVIYAPWSNIQVTGGSDYFGAIVSYNLLLGGNGTGVVDDAGTTVRPAKLHYDENLMDLPIENYSYFLHTSIKAPFKDTP